MKIDVISREKAIFVCLQAAHAYDFLIVIHNDELGQQTSPVEYHTIIR